MHRWWSSIAAVGMLILAGGAGCSREREQVYPVRGVIVRAVQEGEIVISHEDIPDFMPAMTMPFYVDVEADPAVRELKPGDAVEFEFRVGENRSRATNFRRLSAASGAAGRPAAPPTGGSSRRLRPGDALPEFALTDQGGSELTSASLADGYTILTFVFTRCPVPEFCPLIAARFQELQRLLAERGQAEPVRLLSITIDPEYDTPEVLRAYGEGLGADFDRWSFATGERSEIDRLRKVFAVHTEQSGGTLDHTLATALIGPDGKVIEIWRGNGWKSAEVLEALPGR